MVDSCAGVSACPDNHAPESDVKRGSVKLHLVGACGDRTRHIGQKMVGYATRGGANVEIALDAAKALLLVDCLVEKGQVAVFTDTGGFIHPEVCAASGSSGEQTEHEGTERTLLAASPSQHRDISEPCDGGTNRRCGRGVGRRREDGRGSCPWRSGLLEWCGSLAKPRQRSGQLTRERTCPSATTVPTASREHPTQLTGSQTEQRANRR